MPNESPRERASRELRDQQARTRRAAEVLRERVKAGTYAGLPAGRADDLFHVSDLLDFAAIELADYPPGTRSAVRKLVDRVLGDGRRPGEVAPLTAGDGV